jgi:ABC-type lipoprotein export system ATPase subunit
LVPAVELDGVRFAYDQSGFGLVIDHLTIGRGERVACIGPSGSGKTTLAHLIAGILQPNRGTVRVEGVEVSALGDAARRALRLGRIGMVFQQFELLEYLTAGDNILLPYHLGAKPRCDTAVLARAAQLAAVMGIGPLWRRLPGALSQGERQRVATCRALVTQPTLVIADEPTGNLDDANSERLLELVFAQSAEHGAALLMVTHDHRLVDRFHRCVDLSTLQAGSHS